MPVSFGNEWAEATFAKRKSPGRDEPDPLINEKGSSHEKMERNTGLPGLESGR